MERSIGIDLGVTSSSRIAVADGARIISNRRVRSTPEALTRAIRDACGEQPVDIVVESTAMAWFVAAVAAERAGIEHTLYRVSGRKAAALRAFYRAHTKSDRIDAPVLARMPRVDDALHAFTLPSAAELALKRLVSYRQRLDQEAIRAVSRVRSLLHWAAPLLLPASGGTNPALLRVLRRWPDLRKLASAHAPSIARQGGISVTRAREVRECARDAVRFYAERVDYALLALELEIGLAHHATLQEQLERLHAVIESEYARQYPNDVLRSIPGVGHVVGSVIRATVGDARNFTNASAFRAYTGLTPREDSSGDRQQRGRISKGGPSLLRWALYLAADTARKHDPQLAALYRRLMEERGRHHNQATCAVASHLADRIYAVLRENRPYQPRDLDGAPVDNAHAKRIAASLAVTPETRKRLRAINKRENRGSREPDSRQPRVTPHGTARPSPHSLPTAQPSTPTGVDTG